MVQRTGTLILILVIAYVGASMFVIAARFKEVAAAAGLAIVAVAGAFVLYRRIQEEGEEVRRKNGLCPKCGYDLRESFDRCPECGEPLPVYGAKADSYLTGSQATGFSDDARLAIRRAHELAWKEGFEYVGTEHLLLAASEAESGAAAIRERGREPAFIRRKLIEIFGEDGEPGERRTIEMTPAVVRTLMRVSADSKAREITEANCGDLVAALAAETDSVAGELLSAELWKRSDGEDALGAEGITG